MRERPLIFADSSVRAILAGSKTQTRRIAKDAPSDTIEVVPSLLAHLGDLWDFRRRLQNPRAIRCPYGRPGDHIWCKEAWRSWERTCYDGDDHRDDDTEPCTVTCRQVYVAYGATPRVGYRPVPDRQRITYLDESTPLECDDRLLGPWKSPLFMPRWASRITLEIAEVRVQRLHAISEDDARAEGVERDTSPCDHTRLRCEEIGCLGQTYRAGYCEVWCRIHGADAWARNPWVWAITFRRLEP